MSGSSNNISNVKELAYKKKGLEYHSNPRVDFIRHLPKNSTAAILEIGCGDGSTGEMALIENKCRRYVGVEISQAAADIAKSKITDIIIGDIEEIICPWETNEFDVLIASEVLEHLVDPWLAINKLVKYIKPGGLILAGSPNVSNYRVIMNLIKGKWELSESGVMDRSHLRWFTPSSFKSMFESAGFETLLTAPAFKVGKKAQFINFITVNKFSHLFFSQIIYIGRKI